MLVMSGVVWWREIFTPRDQWQTGRLADLVDHLADLMTLLFSGHAVSQLINHAYAALAALLRIFGLRWQWRQLVVRSRLRLDDRQALRLRLGTKQRGLGRLGGLGGLGWLGDFLGC